MIQELGLVKDPALKMCSFLLDYFFILYRKNDLGLYGLFIMILYIILS